MVAYDAYILGTCFLGVGIYTLAKPARAYEMFGIPASKPRPQDPKEVNVAENEPVLRAPFLLYKAGRDISVGALFFVFEYQGKNSAVGALLAITSVLNLVDGILVWVKGGRKGRQKAWNHWVALPANAVLAWKKLAI